MSSKPQYYDNVNKLLLTVICGHKRNGNCTSLTATQDTQLSSLSTCRVIKAWKKNKHWCTFTYCPFLTSIIMCTSLVHRHMTMQVTSICRCCSQVDKREWRFIHLLVRALHPLVNCSGSEQNPGVYSSRMSGSVLGWVLTERRLAAVLTYHY